MLNHQLCKKACAQFSEVGKVACDLFEKEEPTLEELTPSARLKAADS